MSKPTQPLIVSEDLFRFKAGDRFTLPLGALTPDALAVADMVRQCRKAGEKLLIVCADPADVRRLTDETGWFAPELTLRTFPDWETLPYDVLSPQEAIVSERLETLWSLANNAAGTDCVLVSAVTAAQRIAPPAYTGANTFFFKTGDRLSLETLKTNLAAAGYANVKQVLAPGEFAVRGGIVDVFPMGSEQPFRLELFDDEIESIRWFSTDTQRSGESAKEIRLLPGHEFPVDKETLAAFRLRWRTRFTGDPTKSLIYRDIGNGVMPAGVEYYLPLFFEQTASLTDYLPAGTRVLLIGDVQGALTGFMHDTATRASVLASDKERPALRPDELWLSAEDFFRELAKFARFDFRRDTDAAAAAQLQGVTVDRKSQNPLAGLIAFTDTSRTRRRRTLIVAGSAGREGTISELCRTAGLDVTEVPGWNEFLASDAPVALTTAPLWTGGIIDGPSVAVLTETELYASNPRRTRARRSTASANFEMLVRDVSELKIGDPVVHLEHGIGRYQGLVQMNAGEEGEAEFLQIDYKNAKLYVPVANLSLISRYSGADPENAPLHQLGRGNWEKVRRKAAEQVRDTAAELLSLYALRQSRPGVAFPLDLAEYDAFREGFAFEETPDQAAAIASVVADMTSGRPMDRLVCGDVGFGKTEVALRAAFIAVNAGKQVAVLCPTTLLAEQHAQTFRDRFAAWPVQVAELSRFRTGRETTKTLEGLAQGTVDIVIGTHKLLSEKVNFARLGLVIIDEEHRFGVRQKEACKKLRAHVDVLTLTATPIPRTLSMSLEGMRDLSVIATAPERRLSVKTFVQAEQPSLIREAVLRELKRGGQVYFLHNEVETIENCHERLRTLLPEARIGVAHGQMSERELERIMREFCQQKTNLLLCTTIIETGIDIPSANTILIERADKFGLAQLHQLRGRVGRSHHQAYAYLLTPPEGCLTKQAQKRLEAIQSLEELGSGFSLALQDMEIRGAGEILGEHQSGEIAEVGFDLYNRMLNDTVRAMKRGELPDFDKPFELTTEIDLHAPALLPSTYVEDVSQRLGFYKELSSASSVDDIIRTTEALGDRYGKLPAAAERLTQIHRLRLRCETIGIRKIDAAPSATVVCFTAKPNIEPMALIRFMQSRKDTRMTGPDRLRIDAGADTPEKRLMLVQTVLSALEQKR